MLRLRAFFLVIALATPAFAEPTGAESGGGWVGGISLLGGYSLGLVPTTEPSFSWIGGVSAEVGRRWRELEVGLRLEGFDTVETGPASFGGFASAVTVGIEAGRFGATGVWRTDFAAGIAGPFRMIPSERRGLPSLGFLPSAMFSLDLLATWSESPLRCGARLLSLYTPADADVLVAPMVVLGWAWR